MYARINNLRNKLKEKELGAILITSLINCRYLSGFTGTRAVLLLTLTDNILFTDSRYLEQASNQSTFKVVDMGESWLETINIELKKLEVKQLAFEEENLTYLNYRIFKDKWDTVSLVPVSGLMAEIRAIKDEDEVKKVQKAIDLTDRAFDYLLGYIKPGMTEKEIAFVLEIYMRKNGAEKLAFETIVASGKRSAMPHGVASDKKVEIGDVIVLDFGAVVDGYCSDMTRTIFIGHIDIKLRQVYSDVLSAQREAIKKIKSGITGSEADAIARDKLTENGWQSYFTHSLGHGIGLEVHENPRLAVSNNKELLPGMLITVEPGVYISGCGGVRIEDVIRIEEDGCKVLTKSNKEIVTLLS